MTKIATGGHPDLKMVNPAAAEIDIGSTMHMAAVSPAACETPVRAFGTFTQDLHDLADWFKACGVTSIAMRSDRRGDRRLRHSRRSLPAGTWPGKGRPGPGTRHVLHDLDHRPGSWSGLPSGLASRSACTFRADRSYGADRHVGGTDPAPRHQPRDLPALVPDDTRPAGRGDAAAWRGVRRWQCRGRRSAGNAGMDTTGFGFPTSCG